MEVASIDNQMQVLVVFNSSLCVRAHQNSRLAAARCSDFNSQAGLGHLEDMVDDRVSLLLLCASDLFDSV